MLPLRVRQLASRSFNHVNIYITARSFTHGQKFIPKTEQKDQAPPVSKSWHPPRQITLEAHPTHISKGDIVKILKAEFCMTKARGPQFLGTPRAAGSRFPEALVILATPSFAEWLEDEVTFMPFVLSTLLRNTTPRLVENEEREPVVEIDVVCACVDGLAPSISKLELETNQPRIEGFSLLHGHADQILPGLWEASPAPTKENPELQSSITFSSYHIPNKEEQVIDVTLPLANTLFVNGKQSKVLVSRWQSRKNEQFTKVRSMTKSHQRINPVGGRDLGSPRSHLPAVPITPARQIVSGLGNIIRELSFGEDDVGPASRELENNIHEYLRVVGRTGSTISVWALITPKLLPDETGEVLFHSHTSIEGAKELWKSDDLNRKFIGQYLEKGAVLCRVVSGGGGWGAKQGLLSLDPQTTLNTDEEAEFRLRFSDESVVKGREALALEGLARPGSSIQFFVSPEKHDSPLVHDTPPLRHDHPNCFFQSTVFGAVPSTTDDKLPGITPTDDFVDKIIPTYVPGHFGAVSESGIYINSEVYKDAASKKQTVIRSKINLPNSYLYRDHIYQDTRT